MYFPGDLVGAGGPSYTASQIADAMAAGGAPISFMTHRNYAASSGSLRPVCAFPDWVPNFVQSRISDAIVRRVSERKVLSRLRRNKRAILWVWPDPSNGFLERSRSLGHRIVREMINTPRMWAATILDKAARRFGVTQTNLISDASIRDEQYALSLSDVIVSPSEIVTFALGEAGHSAITRFDSFFGWDPARIEQQSGQSRHDRPLRAVFLGRAGLRKGLLTLLHAWAGVHRDAELVIAGDLEADTADEIRRLAAGLNVRLIGYCRDPMTVLRDADIFVFPTVEEGCPLVIHEACAAGLSVLTTRAGAGRIIESGKNGMILDDFDIDAWTAGINDLLSDPGRRDTYSRNAVEAAKETTWAKAGASRLNLLKNMSA